jgi:cystathionine beta-lyase/cystathionine gamma-synthase
MTSCLGLWLVAAVWQVIYVEAISNPLMQVPDLPAVVAFARQHQLTSVIDATFATPVNLRPALSPGFDLVIHSATKYLNGHSDLIAGMKTLEGGRSQTQGSTVCLPEALGASAWQGRAGG